jgi:nicotinamidase-related amidase
MPRATLTLEGFETRPASTALLILDLITALDFPGGKRMFPEVLKAAQRVRALRERAEAARIPIIYVNDNQGRWRSDSAYIIQRCREHNPRGAALVDVLEPKPEHYFIVKPKHSAFFATALEVLLDHARVEKLIITGISSHQCVLFTATEAHMRDYELQIPRDCIAAPKRADAQLALRYFESVLGADTRRSTELRLRRGTGSKRAGR